MKRILGVFLLSVMVCILFSEGLFFGGAQASTSEKGMITQNTTWTKSNSPYTLTGPVGIAKGVTLTIDPGVTVNLGSFYLEVNGTLDAQGTATDKIVFNSNSQSTGPPNNYYSFGAPENILLVYDNPTCKIENAILNQTSINGESSISNATVTINGCFLESNSQVNVFGSTTISNSYLTDSVLLRGASTISGNTFLSGIDIAGGSSGTSFVGTYLVSGNNITNQQGMYAMNVGNSGTIIGNVIWGGSVAGICQADGFPTLSATIENNLIINNQDGILIRTGNDDSTIKDNTITNNTVGISHPTNLQTITGNNIDSNSKYNIQAGQTAATAINNWWGTTDQTAISNSIYDSKDDFNLGAVTFTPFLTAPNTQAAPPNMQFPTPNPTSATPAQTTTPPGAAATQSPTSNQTGQPGIKTTQPVNLIEVGIFALLLVIAVLLAAILFTVRKNKPAFQAAS